MRGNPQATIYCLDIGATHTRMGVSTAGITVETGREHTPHPRNPTPADAEFLHDLVKELIEKTRLRHPAPDALAVSMGGFMHLNEDPTADRPGPFNRQELHLVSPNISQLNGIGIMRWLEALGLNVPVHVENDANAALRALTNYPTTLGINMGSGIAAAVKRNNQIVHYGHVWSCWEMGHGRRWDYPPELTLECACGQYGCLEAIIGSKMMAKRYGVRPEHASPSIYAMMRSDVLKHLSLAIADTAKYFEMETVVMSGRTIASFAATKHFLDELTERAHKIHPERKITISVAPSDELQAMRGAALAAFDHGLVPNFTNDTQLPPTVLPNHFQSTSSSNSTPVVPTPNN